MRHVELEKIFNPQIRVQQLDYPSGFMLVSVYLSKRLPSKIVRCPGGGTPPSKREKLVGLASQAVIGVFLRFTRDPAAESSE